MLPTFSIYEAKAKLSEIIRVVKTRRRVVITDRGVPVAEVVPYQKNKGGSLENRIAQLTTLGAILPAKRDFESTAVAKIPGAVDRFLRQDRD